MRTLSCLFAALTLAGCASTTTPVLDRHFGAAVNSAKAQQTLNPQASRNTDPVAGLDGRAARDATERYYDSFKTPPPSSLNVINIGGSMSGDNAGK